MNNNINNNNNEIIITEVAAIIIIINLCQCWCSNTVSLHDGLPAADNNTSDVTKLLKIRIRRTGILTFKICRMRIEAFILSVGM